MFEPGKLLRGIPITDDHIHLRPEGRMVEAVREFHRQGGTRLLLVHTPYEDLMAARVGSFEAGYQRTLSIAKRVRERGGVEIHVALGPHPVELLALEEAVGLERAVDTMRSGLEAASRHVVDGQAIAIGEIGRPHFPVDKTIWKHSNELMAHGMQLAKEAGCAVILHTEEATPGTFKELAETADAVGIPRGKVVKHHSAPLVLQEENHGIFPSVIAKGDNLLRAARKDLRFLTETDYLDDPERPGAVLGPGTVPRRCARLLQKGILSREDLHRIHEDNVRHVYGAWFTSE